MGGDKCPLPWSFMATSVITFPVPAYQNVSIHPEFFRPKRFFISAITLGILTTITTTVDHDYVIGQLVRILIPYKFGTIQLNERTAYVVAIPSSNQVTLDISSIGMDPFVDPGTTTKAQILAIGDINSGQINTNGRILQLTFIPGSFQNISPL